MRQLIALTLFWILAATPALAERRVALVIGNSGYENVGRLANPVNDAGAVTATLKEAGFDVIESRRDLKYNETRRVLRDFGDKARDADIAVVYYAGHGIEVDGTNYVIPVDAELERDVDVYDEAVGLDRILVAIEPAKKLRLIILDACRDNPFAKTMKRTLGTRAIGRGLGKVEPNSPNTLIAFAAKAGSTASDGDSRNSPFTAALVKHIVTPGLDLRKAFGRVRDEVLKNTSNKQEPFVYGSLGGDDVALVPERAAPPPSPAASINESIRRDYELAERIGSLDVWDSFIANYPTGFYTDAAKAQRRKLIAEKERLEATDKAKAAALEQQRLASEKAAIKEQEEAAARARAAEQARLAAEKAKREEEARVAAAEKAKAEAQAKIAEQERQAAQRAREAEEKAAAAKAAAEKAAIEKAAAEKSSADTAAEEKKIAALAPPASPTDLAPKAGSINRQLQTELRRVGCFTGSLNDDWGSTAQRSLEQFNKRAGLKLEIKTASIDSLEAVRGKTSRVCPLVCSLGYRAEGEKCVEIVCKAGFEVGDDNTCERIEPKKKPQPTAKRDEPVVQPKRAEQPAAKPQASGQIFCDGGGCRPVRSGCRLVGARPSVGGANNMSAALSGITEVCN